MKGISALGVALAILGLVQPVGAQQIMYMAAAVPGPAQPAPAAAPVPAPQIGDAACCEPCCRERCCFCNWQVFGEFLYLRPRSAEIEYAVPFNGPIGPGTPIQVGRTAMVDPDYEPAFRLGFARALDECASLGATYTHFESETADAISLTEQPYVLRAMVLHPSTFDAAIDWLSARAQQDMRFDLVDVDYRHIFLRRDRYWVNYLIGVRYASLEQSFQATFTEQIQEDVRSEINFDGGGIRIGLEGERHACNSGLLVYGKSAASFVGGEFRSTYFQGSTQDPLIVDTSWKAGRLVSMLDLEVGAGWMSCNGRWKLTAGYMVSGWLNVVKLNDYIRGVQANNYSALDDMTDNALTFDGFVARAEVRW
ncbi:MAG: Lpg1974 family pore-forming outer membrane protein [Thermoguttaceae bacterium]|jgi:hypothetical protein|nr:Lpg1974 family pore-forming outer membrane protein [Thermoguttaceae bacterium]